MSNPQLTNIKMTLLISRAENKYFSIIISSQINIGVQKEPPKGDNTGNRI
jgi:hypothetical protein